MPVVLVPPDQVARDAVLQKVAVRGERDLVADAEFEVRRRFVFHAERAGDDVRSRDGVAAEVVEVEAADRQRAVAVAVPVVPVEFGQAVDRTITEPAIDVVRPVELAVLLVVVGRDADAGRAEEVGELADLSAAVRKRSKTVVAELPCRAWYEPVGSSARAPTLRSRCMSGSTKRLYLRPRATLAKPLMFGASPEVKM